MAKRKPVAKKDEEQRVPWAEAHHIRSRPALLEIDGIEAEYTRLVNGKPVEGFPKPIRAWPPCAGFKKVLGNVEAGTFQKVPRMITAFRSDPEAGIIKASAETDMIAFKDGDKYSIYDIISNDGGLVVAEIEVIDDIPE